MLSPFAHPHLHPCFKFPFPPLLHFSISFHAGYLYDLCVKGTTFVTQCFVLDTKNKAVLESRLLLCAATCAMMKQCFSLLGIDTLDRI